MKTLAVLFACALLTLSGCTSTSTVALEQKDIVKAGGKDSKTIDCPAKGAKLTYSVTPTSGKLEISVKDAADGKPFDKQEVTSPLNGQVDGLQGAAGTWTLTVDRSDFSGSYEVTLEC